MILGKKVRVGDAEYTVPAFNIAHWEAWETVEKEAKGSADAPTISATLKRYCPVLLSNLRRNYADLDEAKMMQDMDLVSFNELRGAAHAVDRDFPANPPIAPANPSTGAS
jgi:hypothetical protein